LEGIAIFKLVLEANGFAEFKVRSTGAGQWELVEKEGDEHKPKFALYTGTETDEEKRIILNCYNGRWSEVPSTISEIFKSRGIENNHRGELIKVFMITASGAEGINLKNTRYVHIMEPYWHMVRLDQVIGRAKRICSHQDLPEDMRTVQVFVYIATLTKQQKTDEKHRELRIRDVSPLYKGIPLPRESGIPSKLMEYVDRLEKAPGVVTTDQMLFENALLKDQVNSQILKAVKETAMDCQLYSKTTGKTQNLVCYNLGKITTNAFLSNPSLEQDFAEKDVQEVKTTTLKLVKVVINGTRYAFDQESEKIYDIAEYEDAKENPGVELRPIGHLVKRKGRGGGKDLVFF
jgi:hypothetical protein